MQKLTWLQRMQLRVTGQVTLENIGGYHRDYLAYFADELSKTVLVPRDVVQDELKSEFLHPVMKLNIKNYGWDYFTVTIHRSKPKVTVEVWLGADTMSRLPRGSHESYKFQISHRIQ